MVVYLIISTSNHNRPLLHNITPWLYILSFLHQTTTIAASGGNAFCCISYHFYIKPQPVYSQPFSIVSCISYHFYIKPQLLLNRNYYTLVVYLIISTSNHNRLAYLSTMPSVVYLIISTSNHNDVSTIPPSGHSCISYHFYIKPQRNRTLWKDWMVVYLIISTSNHNSPSTSQR